eukprot:9183342-Alexandrium_andersonii.AAC.1
MSASLVGSEMCIRDRPKTVVLASTRRRARPGPLRANRPQEGGAPVRRRACLLYTSDAADDM